MACIAAEARSTCGIIDLATVVEQKYQQNMDDPLEIITEGCFLGLKFGMNISPTPTGNLRLVSGTYSFGTTSPGSMYHPLEAALISGSATGDWRTDVAAILGVNQEWITGFIDGFAQESESSADADYIQGFLTAEELRVTRYRRHVPDR